MAKSMISEDGVVCDKDLIIKIIRDETGFKKIKNAWNKLAERADTTIYQTFEWNYTWWKFYGRNSCRRLNILTIYYEKQLIGIAPLYTGVSTFGNKILQERVCFIGGGVSKNEQIGFLDDYGISDFLDIIVDPDFTDHVASALVKLFKSNNKFLGNKVILNQVSEESFVVSRLLPELEKSGLSYQLKKVDICPYLDLSIFNSLADYISRIDSSSVRYRFRKTLRAAKAGNNYENDYCVEDVEDPYQLDEQVEILTRLHQKRWNSLGYPGVFFDQRFSLFFKEFIRLAFYNGWVVFKAARDEKGYCASNVLFKFKDRFFGYISGFDQDAPSSKYGPGTGLVLKSIEKALVQKSIKRVSMLRGDEAYKFEFTSTYIQNYKLSIDLVAKKSIVDVAVQYLLTGIAFVYKYWEKERTLFRVQQSQKQKVTRMLSGYLVFRWHTIRSKLKEQFFGEKKFHNII